MRTTKGRIHRKTNSFWKTDLNMIVEKRTMAIQQCHQNVTENMQQ